MSKQASFDVTQEDSEIIREIVARARKADPDLDALSLTMDITACHASGNPLKLRELLEADDFNFAHDVFGIQNCINRESGELTRNFLPRFSVPENQIVRGREGYLRRRKS
jgi:hypothetical protein